MKRLAVLTSHPIQYYAPLFRELAQRVELRVLYAHRATPQQQAAAGFGTAFEWDVDLLSGYEHHFLENISRTPGSAHFGGCDTPDLNTEIQKGRFDALLVTGWHLKSYLQGIIAATREGVPVLVRGDSHLDTPRSKIKRLAKATMYPALLRVFDAALYVGLRNRQYFEHYAYPARRLFHSPHCIDTHWFSSRATEDVGQRLRGRLGIPVSEKVVLFAGKLLDLKRPLDVVEAVAKISASVPISVVVAGSGSLQAAVSERAQDLGVRVHHLGFCNQSAMPSVYSASDVLALPSARETWGLVCNEALACGTPIVVSDAVGCAPDMAADGDVARTFAVGDTAGLATALAQALRAPPSREKIRQVSDRFSVSAAADGIEEAVNAVCAKRTRR